MKRIGVLYNPFSEPSTRVSVEIAEWLRIRGIEVWRGVSHEGRDEPHALEGLDLLLALGGDGTVLRAARLAIQRGIPVLPVALGHLSFMAELQPEELVSGLETLLGGTLASLRPEDTLLLTSDHGNVESIAAPTHTRNPVPLLVVGPAARAFEAVESIMEIADIVDKVTG